MPEEHKPHSWRARPKRHRKLIDRLLGGSDGDSEEKIAQQRTSRGEKLTEDDRRYRIKGQAGGLNG